MRRRSNRLANHFRALGIGRGDRILLMLGNTVQLWEVMLAAIKLGAVVIPATTLLGRDDIVDRLERGRVRAVVVASSAAERFEGLEGDEIRIAVGGTAEGWRSYEAADHASDEFEPDGVTRAGDPLLLPSMSSVPVEEMLTLKFFPSVSPALGPISTAATPASAA